ncbi:unnamed protein product [Ectocarpus sp. CCAP 1310/34]|nr:unnamed protein product [Ectocarpus sp. CCAP 1310/34]
MRSLLKCPPRPDFQPNLSCSMTPLSHTPQTTGYTFVAWPNLRFLAEDRFGREVLNKEFILPDNLHLTGDGLDAWADCAEAAVHSGLGEG